MLKILYSLLFVFSIFADQSRRDILKLNVSDNFEELEGKQTEDWNNVREKDIEQLDIYKNIYEKNISFLNQKNQEYRIPKIIHFIWLGPKPFPITSIKNVRSWLANHPDWKFMFWTDRKRPAPCNDMEVINIKKFEFKKLKNEYDISDNWAQKSDILRFEILFQYGGIYVDHDANSVKKFDDLCKNFDFFAGLETPHEEINDYTITLGIGLIGSMPKHPFVDKTMDKIINLIEQIEKKYPNSDPYHIANKTLRGTYSAATYAVLENINTDENLNIILPASYFYGRKGLPSFYSQHYYSASWREYLYTPDFEKDMKLNLRKIKMQINKQLFMEFVLFVTFICGIVMIKKGCKMEEE